MLELDFKSGQIFPVSKLDKLYVNFIPLGDTNLMEVSDSETKGLIFRALLICYCRCQYSMCEKTF